MSIMLTIFDVSIKEKRVDILFTSSANEQEKKKYIDLCQLANKYKQVMLETLSWMFNGIQRVTYVTWAVKIV